MRLLQRSLLPPTVCLGLSVFVMSLAVCPSVWAQSGPYSKEVPYQQAVPNLFGDIIDRFDEVPNINEIYEWHNQTRARLPEAIDDMIAAIMKFEGQNLQNINIEPFQEFSDKWNTIVQEYPGLASVEPLLVPIFEELTQGLTGPRAPRPGDVPFQNFYEFYQAMEIDNPWGTAILFRLEPLEQEIMTRDIKEQLHEEIQAGIKTVDIVYRNTQIVRNGKVIFCETIENNQIVKQEFGPYDITLIHEIARRLKEEGADPDLIDVMEQLARLIEDNVTLAWQSGKIPNEVYFYFLTGRKI